MADAVPARESWPFRPADGYHAEDNRPLPDEGEAQDVIGEMALLLRDTRGNMILGGSVLAAITIGIALEAAFSVRVMPHGVVGALNVVLLCGLLGCWLRAVALLALAGRPVLDTLSELRWKTGAPLDPRPMWLTLPPPGSNQEEWIWTRAHLLLAAARLTRYRIQLADTWTYLTVAGFLVWTAVVFVGL